MMGNKHGLGHICIHTEETRRILSKKLESNKNALGHTFKRTEETKTRIGKSVSAAHFSKH